MTRWLVIASILLASAGSADAAKLTFGFTDAAGDGHASGDLQGMRFHFDDVTGAYSIELRAHPAQPFAGDFRINVNLFDPDAGANQNPALFQDSSNDFNLAAPATRILLTGTNSRLTSWDAGDRVAANHVPFGSPAGSGIFSTGLMDLPVSGFFCETAQDCLGPLDASNFTTITALETIFDNFDPGGGFHASNNTVASTAYYNFFFTITARAAARFTVTGGTYQLDSITLPIGFVGSGPAPILRVRLTTDAGGAPGTTLEVLSENENIWPPVTVPLASATTLVSTTNPLLQNGVSYWIVTEPTAVLTGIVIDHFWWYNTTGTTVVARQQTQNPGLVQDPWPGAATSLPLAFRVDGILVACSDGADNDGDGLTDALDPGCQSESGLREDPHCDDDLDNDGDGAIDWDGGASAGAPDPQCAGKPWRNSEKPSCGLGVELALLLPMVAALRRRKIG